MCQRRSHRQRGGLIITGSLVCALHASESYSWWCGPAGRGGGLSAKIKQFIINTAPPPHSAGGAPKCVFSKRCPLCDTVTHNAHRHLTVVCRHFLYKYKSLQTRRPVKISEIMSGDDAALLWNEPRVVLGGRKCWLMILFWCLPKFLLMHWHTMNYLSFLRRDLRSYLELYKTGL